MSTRKIKDAKDLSTNELIYFKGHAQATYMSDGRTVEEAINDIDTDGGTTDLSNVVQYNGDGQVVIKNGTMYDGNEGISYALPSASDEDKGKSNYVIASEQYIDDKLDGKQPTLVSGTNIKTINGESILGSGDIVISGGGSSGGGSKEFVAVAPYQEPLGYYGNLVTIVPNNVYVFTKPIYALGVSLLTQSDSKGDEYSIMFTASKDNISISLPSGSYNIYWANGVVPNINSTDLCELSLVRIGYDIKAVLTTFKAV